MHSPPVQPISASRSGIGGVATMSLETTTSARRSSGSAAAQAFVATTSLLGRAASPRRLDDQRALAGEARSRACARRSARRAPAPRAAGRGRAARAGRSRRRASKTPARWRSRARRGARPPPGSGARRRRPRCCSQSPTTPSQAPTCDGVVAVHRKPPRRNWASMPCSSQNAAIASIASCGGVAEPQRLLDAAELDQAGQLRPPGQHHAAVAARRAAAADVALEHDDVARRGRAA